MEVKDYMKLSKKRLAELLVERDARDAILRYPSYPIYINPNEVEPCYFGGQCTNPERNCFGCPRNTFTVWCGSNTRGENKQNDE